MSIDLEQELRATMQGMTADIQAPPDLLARVSRRHRRVGRPRVAIALGAAAAAGIIVAVTQVVPRVGDVSGTAVHPLSTYKTNSDFAQQEQQAQRDINDAIANWGPTRGDRAVDSQVLAQVRAEWAHPSSHPVEMGSFEAVINPDGPVQVLWAGSTPDGVAALAVQHTKDPVAEYWYGEFLPDSGGRPVLAHRGQVTAGLDLGELDPHAFAFTTSTSHDAVVVIPTQASDRVRLSFRADKDADGMLMPQWQDAQVRDGAAVADMPAGGNAWGTVVEVTYGASAPDVHALDFIAIAKLNEGPLQPANVVGLWCNGCTVGGGSGPGYSSTMLRAWTVRHGPSYLPTYVAEWSIGTHLPDGAAVFATQLWTVGQPAHTVVIADDQSSRTIQVLYDEETDASARPLLAVRLPQSAGWLVGAGPDTVVTGWRTLSGNWHRVASKPAVLVPTDDASIQLRIMVGGQERIVTR